MIACLDRLLIEGIPFLLMRNLSSLPSIHQLIKAWGRRDPCRVDSKGHLLNCHRNHLGRAYCPRLETLTKGAEQTLVRKKLLSPAVVLNVAHHGSDTSTTSAFLGALKPAIAIISAGAGNSYGHPTASVLARLKASGAKVYRTDLDGTVSARCDGATWQVETERDDEKKAAAPAPVPVPAGRTGQKYYGSKNSDVFHYPMVQARRKHQACEPARFASRQEAID